MEFARRRTTCSAPPRSFWKLAVVFTLTTLLQYGSGLQCYYCSIKDDACLDPFTPDNATMQQACPSWANICIKTVERGPKDAAEHVFRGCFQDNFRGLDACMALRMAARSEGLDMLSCEMCTTDFCNSITSPPPH